MPAYYYPMMIGVILLSYVIGSVNFAVIISRKANKDVRGSGSGNPGTMNMLRTFGLKLGILTLLLDVIKGAVPALIGWFMLGKETFVFGADKSGVFIAGLAVVIGHIFPVLYKMRGGKGVACAIGVALVADPIVALASFVVALVFFIVVKIGSLASFIATGIPLIYDGVKCLTHGNVLCGVLSLAIFAIVLAAHHRNLVRIFTGKERKTDLFKKKESGPDKTERPTEEVAVADVEEIPRESENPGADGQKTDESAE